jgi:hypothetical protein
MSASKRGDRLLTEGELIAAGLQPGFQPRISASDWKCDLAND